MNLDLLMKLTRLANNNPNEHEANLAARKVCKMLEEGKFSLAPSPVETERRRPVPPPPPQRESPEHPGTSARNPSGVGVDWEAVIEEMIRDRYKRWAR